MDDIDAAYAAWFDRRWPTGWWEAKKLNLGVVIREAFVAGYAAKGLTGDACQTDLVRQCKVTAE